MSALVPSWASVTSISKAYVWGVTYTRVEEELGLSAPGAWDPCSSGCIFTGMLKLGFEVFFRWFSISRKIGDVFPLNIIEHWKECLVQRSLVVLRYLPA